jgi:glycosyltransferase involved in cell wall biosynthesis
MQTDGTKKLKLLFLAADKFPPFRVDVTVLFGQEITGRGHTIDWLLQSEKPLRHSYETRWKGGKAFVGRTGTGPGLKNRIRMHLFNWRHDWKMFQLLRTGVYDILIVKDKFIAGVMAAFATRLYKTKFIYWFSFPFDEDSFFRVKEKTVRFPLLYWARGILFRILLYRIILPCCDHALVQTEYMKSEMVRKGAPGAKMTAVPMAVSIEEIPFFGYTQRSADSPHCPTVVYLGTLIKTRRMDFLLRAFKMLIEQISEARLYLVGGSEDQADEVTLKQEAEKLGIARAVTITGFLPQRQAWEYVQKADVCVSPIYPSPIYDVGSPTKLLEYMAMGKASVANDQPEQKVVLAESQAGICVPWNEASFCQAMAYLLNHPGEARQMGLKGRQYVEVKRNYKQTADIVDRTLLEINGSFVGK